MFFLSKFSVAHLLRNFRNDFHEVLAAIAQMTDQTSAAPFREQLCPTLPEVRICSSRDTFPGTVALTPRCSQH